MESCVGSIGRNERVDKGLVEASRGNCNKEGFE